MAAYLSPACRILSPSLIFRIPTEQFVSKSEYSQKTCTTHIRIDEQPDYPDIPASVWTVTVQVGEADGKVSASVFPKSPVNDLQCSSHMTVIHKVMWCMKDAVGLLGDFQIGPGGCSDTDAADLGGLAEGHYFDSYRKTLYDLRKNAVVLVHLTFHVKQPTARRDLKELLASGTLSDCTLICDGQDFPAHRAILAAQSPVFTAMFQNDIILI